MPPYDPAILISGKAKKMLQLCLLTTQHLLRRTLDKLKDASTLPANDAVPPSTTPGQAKDASTLPANDTVPPSTNPGQAKDASTLPANDAVPPSTNPGQAKRCFNPVY
ncbi:hypothetical protein EDB89DRAFT_2079065 [Lactarius sanguifluus]|nr:hypothetical protein EDB89DRAFT_2079065 [Lactarius sanguifluus]